MEFIYFVFAVQWIAQLKITRERLRQCPQHAGEIGKRNFISAVMPTFHTNPSRKRSFSKTLFKPEEFENAGFSFSLGPGKKASPKRCSHDNNAISSSKFSSNTNPK